MQSKQVTTLVLQELQNFLAETCVLLRGKKRVSLVMRTISSFLSVFLVAPFQPDSHSVAQAGLKLTV